MKGSELRTRREVAGILQWEVAAAMRVTSPRVSQIEALARVTTRTTERYLAALDVCLLAKTTSDAQAVAS